MKDSQSGHNATGALKMLLPALIIAASATALTGCAGVQSDFECNATAGDSCMTMEDANNKAREMAAPAAGKQAATSLPRLVNLPQRLASAPAIQSAPAAQVAPVISSAPFLKPATAVITPTQPHPDAVFNAGATGERCLPRRCDDAGQARAVRTHEVTASVWIAPWVDTGDVFHQPGRVSFVVSDPHWQLPAVIE